MASLLSEWRRKAAIKKGKEQAQKDLEAAKAREATPEPAATEPSPEMLGSGMAAGAAKQLKSRRETLDELEKKAVR